MGMMRCFFAVLEVAGCAAPIPRRRDFCAHHDRIPSGMASRRPPSEWPACDQTVSPILACQSPFAAVLIVFLVAVAAHQTCHYPLWMRTAAERRRRLAAAVDGDDRQSHSQRACGLQLTCRRGSDGAARLSRERSCVDQSSLIHSKEVVSSDKRSTFTSQSQLFARAQPLLAALFDRPPKNDTSLINSSSRAQGPSRAG